MTLPALAAVAGLAAAAHVFKKNQGNGAKNGSRSVAINESDKKHMLSLINSGTDGIKEAMQMSQSFGHEQIDLSGMYIPVIAIEESEIPLKINASNSYIEKMRLENISLESSSMVGSSFNEFKIYECVISETQFNNSEFTFLSIDRSDVTRSSFSNCVCRDYHSNILNCIFDSSDMSKIILRGVSIFNSTFKSCNFSQSKINRSIFRELEFIECIMDKFDINETKLKDVQGIDLGPRRKIIGVPLGHKKVVSHFGRTAILPRGNENEMEDE